MNHGGTQTRNRPGRGCRHRRLRSILLPLCLCASAVQFSGCGGIDPDSVAPLRTQLMFGAAGRELGQFNYPRSLAVDHERRFVFVVDRSGRIQRFGFDGRPQLQWRVPDWEMGMPVGLSVCPDGRLLVADTHYFRVLIYDGEGNELQRFGEYGLEPGQFVYTTRIAVGPEGRLYVAETGGNDRIQVFDADGNYLFHFGSFGSEIGQFSRPQSIVFNRERTELYIVDACNHRVVVVDPQGEYIRHFGRPGRGAGELAYPYDVHLLGDGGALVIEYHNARIQKFDAEGRSRGLFGRLGRGEGELLYPWSVDGDDETLFVLDSGNNRVQKIRTP